MTRSNRDNTQLMLGEIRNEQARGVEDRAVIRQAIEGLRTDIRSLLDLPTRMTNLETVVAANHSAHVKRLAAVEDDVAKLKELRAARDGERKGVAIGVAVASAAGGGGIVAATAAILRKWGFI